MEKFDVIIVGAGPAGLKCAETFGNSDLNVLILEKNSKIGPKVGAGGLREKDVEYLKLPKKLIDFKSKKVKVHINKNSYTIKTKTPLIYTVNRENLGQWQLKKLSKFKNIEVRRSSRVSKITKNYVVVGNKKIKYKYLVGADGSTSVVKNYLGISSKKIGIATQYKVPIKKRYPEFFFKPKLFSWYFWIFPHKGKTSVGVGSDSKIYSSKELIKSFDKWLSQKNIDVSKSEKQTFVINYDYKGYDFGNIFLVGDAGGFASGLTGKGIYPALITGEEIAKIILNKPNRNYKPKKLKKILRKKKKQEFFLNTLIKSGKLRLLLFYFSIFFMKIPYFKNKTIKLFS